MYLKKIIFCFIFSFLFCFVNVNAQESMMSEVSNSFLDTLIKIAKDNYPKMKAFDKRISIAENNVKKTKISWFETLNTSYLYNPGSSFNLINPSFFNGFQFGVSINVGSILEKPFQIRNAKKELEITKYEKQEYDLNLEALVKERYFIYIQQQTILKSRMQSAQDQENILKSVRYKFERGEETLQNYNMVLIGFSTQNQQKIVAEAEFLIAQAHLEEIIGKKLKDIK